MSFCAKGPDLLFVSVAIFEHRSCVDPEHPSPSLYMCKLPLPSFLCTKSAQNFMQSQVFQ